jgi:acyl carrier protein
MSATLAKLTTVFHDVFEDDDIVLTRETTAADIAGWDSLRNVMLMRKVGRTFGIPIDTSEVTGLKNVGALVDMIDRKKGA